MYRGLNQQPDGQDFALVLEESTPAMASEVQLAAHPRGCHLMTGQVSLLGAESRLSKGGAVDSWLTMYVCGASVGLPIK